MLEEKHRIGTQWYLSHFDSGNLTAKCCLFPVYVEHTFSFVGSFGLVTKVLKSDYDVRLQLCIYECSILFYNLRFKSTYRPYN